MSWPLGYARSGLPLETSPDGTLRVHGREVTEPNGWLDVPLPVGATFRGAPSEITVRIRVLPDEAGIPFLYAEQVEVAGRRHNSLHAMMAAEGTNLTAPLTRAIHSEILRRAMNGSEAAAAKPTRSLRAVRPGPAPRSADETWGPMKATGTDPLREDRS